MRQRLDYVLVGAMALAGCTQPPEDGPSGHASVGQHEEAIVNGSLDTVHQAVVAYLQGGKCTATIIAVDVPAGMGYALTAAHCLSNQAGMLRQGDNHANGSYDVQYPVVERDSHPGYDDSVLYDYAMLRFSGATSSTPFIPALGKSLDLLANGTQLDLVGYGQTEDGGTTLRRHVVKPLFQHSDLQLIFDQSSSGMCSGDSGGPSLHTVATTEYVAGVNVAVSTGGCIGPSAFGRATRVSAVKDTFIQPFIDGTPYQDQSCDECTEAHTTDGNCQQATSSCFDDADCDAYVDCLHTCTTQVCVNICKQQHPSGSQLYQGIFDCLCTSACVSECTGDPQCQPPPACGINWTDDDCEACADQFCCDAVSACSVDETCMGCIGSSSPGPECDAHPQAVALTDCLAQSCDGDCNLPSGSGGAGGSASGVGGGMGPAGTSVGTGAQIPVENDAEGLEVEQGCGCLLPGRGARSRAWMAMLAALGLALLRQRRRGRSE
jgi:hypothetical protein